MSILETIDSRDSLHYERVHHLLNVEFDKLNSRYFQNELVRPEIVLSRRKTYGGYYQPKRHRIIVSWQAYVEHGWDEIMNTFRHEVAHIVHANHSSSFWELATRIGVVKRYAASPLKQPTRAKPRFIYECPKCRKQILRHRRLRLSSCGSCDKVYNPRLVLILVKD